MALANSLAVVAPEELLSYPSSCVPVDSVLRSQALRQGWMIYLDHITDAEGTEIAKQRPGGPEASAPVPLEITDLVQGLSLKLRCHLQSYLLMVGPGGPCASNESLRAIHAALISFSNEGNDDELGKTLRGIYPSGPPELAAWKKGLNRIEKRFLGQAEAEALLRYYGLFRQEDVLG